MSSNLEKFVGVFEENTDLLLLLKYLYKHYHGVEDLIDCRTIQHIVLAMKARNAVRKNVVELLILYERTFSLPSPVLSAFWGKDNGMTPDTWTLQNKYNDHENVFREVLFIVSPIKALIYRVEKLESENAKLYSMLQGLVSK